MFTNSCTVNAVTNVPPVAVPAIVGESLCFHKSAESGTTVEREGGGRREGGGEGGGGDRGSEWREGGKVRREGGRREREREGGREVGKEVHICM